MLDLFTFDRKATPAGINSHELDLAARSNAAVAARVGSSRGDLASAIGGSGRHGDGCPLLMDG